MQGLFPACIPEKPPVKGEHHLARPLARTVERDQAREEGLQTCPEDRGPEACRSARADLLPDTQEETLTHERGFALPCFWVVHERHLLRDLELLPIPIDRSSPPSVLTSAGGKPLLGF